MNKELLKKEFDIQEEHLKQIEDSEVSFEDAYNQIKTFKEGIPYLRLKEPAKIENGIVQINEKDYDNLFDLHKKAAEKGRFMKFVPASGAASRMFKKLETVNNRYNSLTINELIEKSGEIEEEGYVLEFIKNIKDFAFYDDLKSALKEDGFEIKEILEKGDFKKILDYTLTLKGLNYANLPKGSIKFHNYKDHSRTAFEEHLIEAAEYVADSNNVCKLHFTIPEEHTEDIKKMISDLVKKYEKSGIKFEISYSVQHPTTDTIAVTHDNELFIEDEKIHFRPAGHGALLKNLNDLNADIIFIKNIDNVVPDHLKPLTYKYKKLLAGYLVLLQKKVFDYLKILEIKDAPKNVIEEVSDFAYGELNIHIPDDFASKTDEEKRLFLFDKLNRPIRICGMVENEGHSGGGPFWVEDQNGHLILQIVEGPQIDLEDKEQKNILEQSTHFNPVDLVCGVKDYTGANFNLIKHRDPDAGIITFKSKNGKELKALELPGLWNQSMYDWISVFVEVPKETFTPVKEVNDLLKPEHQPE